jgi:hypothetical protein
MEEPGVEMPTVAATTLRTTAYGWRLYQVDATGRCNWSMQRAAGFVALGQRWANTIRPKAKPAHWSVVYPCKIGDGSDGPHAAPVAVRAVRRNACGGCPNIRRRASRIADRRGAPRSTQIGYIKQNGANNPLGDRIDLGGPVNVSGFDVGQNLDGTLSVFAASDNLICHIKQAGKNSDTWAAETPFPV